ncbi:MAG TPA: hypothetical protein VF526_19795 [Solirubrobacteraceae bacterium]
MSSAFELDRILDTAGPVAPAAMRIRVHRPDDLLVFDLRFHNLELKLSSDRSVPPSIERAIAGRRAQLIVEFPAQSIAEEAFVEDGATDSVPALAGARTRMAGPSRLSFVMPESTSSLPYTLAAVLAAMRTWPLELDANALPDVAWKPVEPGDSKPGPWLADALRSPGLLATFDELSSALEAAGGRGAGAAVQAAAARVAQRAAGGLAGSAGASIGKVAFEAMQTELDAVHRQFPKLRDGPVHEAGIAALALWTARTLADTRGDSDPDVLLNLPYMLQLLAPHRPAANATALELPYRLVISPLAPARWLHRDEPATRRGRTELWHTRLRIAPGQTGPDGVAMLRALWSPDYKKPSVDVAGFEKRLPPLSLTPADRRDLVKLMTRRGVKTAPPDKEPPAIMYTPRPSRVRRMHLSALGALFDAEGTWDPRPHDVDLVNWRHVAAVGRDTYVRILRAGKLGCCGHSAVLAVVTERKFEALGTGRAAVLRKNFFLIPTEPVREYTGAGHEFAGRNFPFSRVEILTKVTPNLAEPGKGKSFAWGTNDREAEKKGTSKDETSEDDGFAFWPMLGVGNGLIDFRFDILATDRSGNRVPFSIPLLFMDEKSNRDHASDLQNIYNDEANEPRRTADLRGASVCYVPPGGDSAKGDPRLPTGRMVFRAGRLAPLKVLHAFAPNFYPETELASVGIRPIQKLLGQPNAVVEVTYPEVYKNSGFDLPANKGETEPENKGQLFLQVVDKALPLAFGGKPEEAKSDALGALAAPQMTILGLSRLMGPVAGKPPPDLTVPNWADSALGDIVGSTFDPKQFFEGATILGGVELATILNTVSALTGADVPKLVSTELEDRIESRFDWSTKIAKPDPLNLLLPRADGGHDSTLTMKGLVTTQPANPAGSSYEATATLDNFKVNLFGFIILWFRTMAFEARNGQKPDVTVDLHPSEGVRFGGPLEFVNTLREIIPCNGFSDPPALSVTPSGIAASYSLNLPALTVGVFSLTNASLGAGFGLPFDAKPASVKFSFSTREQPFTIAVMMLGGGGFFGIGISANGVDEIEAALEFGATLAINLGVASGSVEIKAGVYFHWLQPLEDKKNKGGGSVELTGYVRLHGELSVLGLISASLTFNLQLSYTNAGGRKTVWGEATLTIEVEVLFVSFDVSVTCRKEFGGDDSDPKFIECMPEQETWAEYCSAFAEEAA